MWDPGVPSPGVEEHGGVATVLVFTGPSLSTREAPEAAEDAAAVVSQGISQPLQASQQKDNPLGTSPQGFCFDYQIRMLALQVLFREISQEHSVIIQCLPKALWDICCLREEELRGMLTGMSPGV